MSSIDQKARDVSRPGLEAVGRVLTRWNVSPDWVTGVGLVLTAGVAAMAALGYIQWAGVAYIVAAVFDALDGTVARVSGKVSRFGAFLDSTIDRLEESLVFLGLIIYYARVGGPWDIPMLLVVTVASLMVSYTRARAEALGVACTVGWMTRPIRVAIMIAGMILNQVFIAVVIIAVTSLFTTFHRVFHVWRMTGGEPGGWGPVKEPFVLAAAAPVSVPAQDEAGDAG
jgi:CDP-diacylglycerol--glycerol-3-phosphate 3-phosphatidyltransferase